jgi:hypothetical protein
MAMAQGVVLLAAMAVGLVIDGIGLLGLLLTVLAVIGVLGFSPLIPGSRCRTLLATINRGGRAHHGGPHATVAGSAGPRPPRPGGAPGVDQIGAQLDGAGRVTEGSTRQPAVAGAQPGGRTPARHGRSLAAYPRRTCGRNEARCCCNADQQLTDGLAKISGEIDQITRQLAAGDIDALAIRGRYLDYRYGEAGRRARNGPARGEEDAHCPAPFLRQG